MPTCWLVCVSGISAALSHGYCTCKAGLVLAVVALLAVVVVWLLDQTVEVRAAPLSFIIKGGVSEVTL